MIRVTRRPKQTAPSAAPCFEGATSQTRALQSDTALVVIDSQIMFCTNRPNRASQDPDVVVSAVERKLDQIARARDYADAVGIPTFLVYLVYNEGAPHHELPFGDGDFGLYRQRLTGLYELAVKPHESAFRENKFSSIKPELPGLLANDYTNVKHLVFTGFNTSMCVLETAQDAIKRGYNVSVLADCTANARKVYYGREGRALAQLEEQGAWIGTLDEWKSGRALTQPGAAPANRPAWQGSLTLAG